MKRNQVTRLLLRTIALLVLASASQAFATDPPTAQAPGFLPGDTFSFCRSGYYNRSKRTCYTQVYVGELGGNHTFQSKEEQNPSVEVVMTRDLALISSGPRRVDPHTYFLEFPMAVGRTWAGTYVDRDTNRTRTARVVAYDKITVPAGTFDAYRVEVLNKWNSPLAGGAARESYAYCPVVGLVCSYESVDFDFRFELISFKRQGENAVSTK